MGVRVGVKVMVGVNVMVGDRVAVFVSVGVEVSLGEGTAAVLVCTIMVPAKETAVETESLSLRPALALQALMTTRTIPNPFFTLDGLLL